MPTPSAALIDRTVPRQGLVASRPDALARRPILPICVSLIAATDLVLLSWAVDAAMGVPNTLHPILGVAACVALLAAQRLGLYELASLRNPQRRLLHFALVAAVVPAAISTVAVTSDTAVLDLAAGFVACLLTLAISRAGAAAWLHNLAQQGRLDRRVAIYGSPAHCRRLVAALRDDPDSTIRICALFSDRGELAGAGLGPFVDCIRRNAIDLVIVALPITAEDRLLQVVDALDALPVDVRVAADASRLRLNPRAYSWLGNVALIDLSDRPLSDWNRCIKGAFDRLIALVALIVLCPLMMILAALIRIDSKGPVLFRQKRLGLNNAPIEVLKFRSMHAAASDAHAVRLVTRQDARVTRVGRFMRKTSLDELPQLLNVLRGDMSLVGPRPHALQAKAGDRLYHDVVDRYFARHRMKPGITGWAQINGWRGETDTADKIRQRVEHDAYYIQNWSLLFDIYILLRTPIALLRTGNAY